MENYDGGSNAVNFLIYSFSSYSSLPNILIRNLKQPLYHASVLKKLNTVIWINQKTWLKVYTDINIELKKIRRKIILKKRFQGDEWCNIWLRYKRSKKS